MTVIPSGFVVTLPPYTPTDWELKLPDYPIIAGSWRSVSLPDALGSIPSESKLRLIYENRTSDEALALLLPWRATGGGEWPLADLPPEVAFGINDTAFARRLTSTTWVMAREPQKESVKNGRFNITIDLVYELTFISKYGPINPPRVLLDTSLENFNFIGLFASSATPFRQSRTPATIPSYSAGIDFSGIAASATPFRQPRIAVDGPSLSLAGIDFSGIAAVDF